MRVRLCVRLKLIYKNYLKFNTAEVVKAASVIENREREGEKSGGCFNFNEGFVSEACVKVDVKYE